MLRLANRPVVLGKRIELIHTDNPYADLKLGDRGTVVDVSELSYGDRPFKVWVLWDSGSRLTILEGHDDYRMVYDDDDDWEYFNFNRNSGFSANSDVERIDIC